MEENDDSSMVWLLKLPGFLHEHLKSLEPGCSVGSVVGGGAGTHLELSRPIEGGKPVSFSVKARPLDQQLKAFRQTSEGRVEMVGSVGFKGDLVPGQGAAYASMLEKKMKKTEVKAATALVESSARQAVNDKREMYKRMREEMAEQRNAAPVQKLELTREEMVTAILTLFEEQTHWAKRDIMKRTDQSEKLVNDVLKELAIAETAGEHKNEFALRDEFRIKTGPVKKQKK